MYVKRKENKNILFFSHIEMCLHKYQPGVEVHGPLIPIKLHTYEETEVLKDYRTLPRGHSLNEKEKGCM